MTKLHTPGPWVWGATNSSLYALRAPDTNDAWIAATWGDPNSANAQLIAAAPDLLAAMRRAYRMLVCRNSHPVISDNLAAAIHDAAGPMHCNTCKSTGYVQCDYDEFEPCGSCLGGREIAEEEAKNA
jgi:hypothetical protein